LRWSCARRYPEAFLQIEEAWRGAISNERSQRQDARHAQFALGIILMERKKFTDEAVGSLVAAGEINYGAI